MNSVVQHWVSSLTLMQQTVLLSAIRGPDGVRKYHPAKYIQRWYRRCILLSALDKCVWTDPLEGGGGSFTGPSVKVEYATESSRVASNGHGHFIFAQKLAEWERHMEPVIDDYLKSLDELPHHFQMHFLHAVEILGYKHPDFRIRNWWNKLYLILVSELHLNPESETELDRRLSDSREEWLRKANIATSS